MILFLDFDGVLHPEPCYDPSKLFCHRELFESVILECPDVEIVISSTWRHNHSLVEIRSLFSSGVSEKVVGVTPNYADLPELRSVIGQYPRHVEVEGYLRQSGMPWQDWVALDDRAYWFKPFLRNLVRCDPMSGMTPEVADLLRIKLAGSRKF